MKRDWELIRKILSAVEDQPAGETPGSDEIETEDHRTLVGQVAMLKDAARWMALSASGEFTVNDSSASLTIK